MKTKKIIVRLIVILIIAALFALPSCGNKHNGHENNNTDKIFEIPLLSFGEVTFAVNVNKDNIVLISSTQVDDPKVMLVVNYLNSIYGEAWEDEPDNYWWNTYGHNKVLGGSTVRLRPLHSEEGGTVIMID